MHSKWSAIVAVAAAFGLVLGAGFLLQEWNGGMLGERFGLFAGIAIGVVAGAIYCLLTGTSPWRLTGRAPRKPICYAERVHWRAVRQDAYDKDPSQTVSCVHLAPIERAMRAAGLKIRLDKYLEHGPSVAVTCRINVPELQRVFALPMSIYYRECYQPERSSLDNPRADIFCGGCLESDRSRCDIQVLHPEECQPDTPWFPAPP